MTNKYLRNLPDLDPSGHTTVTVKIKNKSLHAFAELLKFARLDGVLGDFDIEDETDLFDLAFKCASKYVASEIERRNEID